MKNGDIVFFKKVRPSFSKKSEVTFKGYGFGMLLGNVPPFALPPPESHLIRLLGAVGLLTFDDVGEFLGKEALTEVIKKFEKKYIPTIEAKPRETVEPPTELPLIPLKASPGILLDKAGNPISNTSKGEI